MSMQWRLFHALLYFILLLGCCLRPAQALKVLKTGAQSGAEAAQAMAELHAELAASDTGPGGEDVEESPAARFRDDDDEEEVEDDGSTNADRLVVVVGTGRSVLGADLGGLIDKFKTVVRVGPFQTRGFEQDVGSKTHYWARAHAFLSQDEPPVRTLTAEEAFDLKELVVPIVFHPCDAAVPDSTCKMTPTQSKLLNRNQEAAKKNVRKRFMPSLQNAPKEKISDHSAFGEMTYYEDQVKMRIEKLKETDSLYMVHRLEEAVPSLNLVALNYFLAKYPRAKVAYAGLDFDGSVYWERSGGMGTAAAGAVAKAGATCENTNDEARIIREWEESERVYRLVNKGERAEPLPTPAECKASGKLSATAAEADAAREGRKDRRKQKEGRAAGKAGAPPRRRPKRPPAVSTRAESRRARAGQDGGERRGTPKASLLDEWSENTDNR